MSQAVSSSVGVDGKFGWLFLICVLITCFSKINVQEIGDRTHACLVILGIFCALPFSAKM